MVKLPKVKKNISVQVIIQLLLVTAGVFFTSINHYNHQKSLDDQITKALHNKLIAVSTGINERLKLYLLGVKSMRGAINGIGINELNYKAIANYSNSHNYQLELPGTSGIGFIKKVSPEDLNKFINSARADRVDKKFNLRELSKNEKNRFIIQYIFPESSNSKAIGLDIASEKVRSEAAINAALNNTVQLSAPITLVQANNKSQQGFLMLLPIYNTINKPIDKKFRYENTVGWAFSPLLIGDVLKSLSEYNLNYLNLKDISNNSALTFFKNGNINDVTHYSDTKTFPVMGRSWQIDLTATHAFIRSLNLPGKYNALLYGLLLTVLIMLIVFIIQIILFKKEQNTQREIELSKNHKKELEDINLSLEKEVENRTKQLAEVSMLQRSILTNASYVITATDINGVITLFNPAAEKLLGYQVANIIGIESPALFHIEEEVVKKAQQLTKELNRPVTPGFDTFVAKVSPNKPDISQWTYVTSKGNHIPVELSVAALLSDNGELVGYLGIAYDLTEQIAQKNKLALAKNAAEDATKAKSEFLANMSHEIRTPINGLFGMLQLLQDLPHDQQSSEYISKALYSTKALNTIINDILDFSKIEAGKLSIEKTTFELNHLLNSLTSDLAFPVKEKGLTFNIISTIEHEYWIGDPARLRQVFLNLMSNAIKFTHHGSITFEIMMANTDEMLFIISDTGIGISQDALSRLFQRFEQADTSTTRKYCGTGLGLTITKSLIELMNGKIEVVSELNVGSKFSVYIPLNKSNTKPENNITKVIEYPNLNGKTILLVEDNKINQVVAKAMLKPSNAKIVIANDGNEAVNQYKKQQPDIIFMDIQMPIMDGIAACRIIKKLNPEQKVIALTANVLPEQKKVYEELFDGYLSKPIEKHKLIASLLSVYNQ